MSKNKLARIALVIGTGLAMVALVGGAVVLVLRLDPLSRYPFNVRRVTPAPAQPAQAPSAPSATTFDAARIHDRMGNAGMVAIYTTADDAPIYITVAPDQVTLRIGRPQDIDAALALVPMLFTDAAQGQLAQGVAGEVIRAGCNGAEGAGNVMVTAQMRPAGGAAVCEVVFA